jgi:phage tail sheath gpL-like
MGISDAVTNSAVARVVGIQTQFKDLRGGSVLFVPQRIALIGQGNTASTYATTKAQVTSAGEVATAYGFGSPLHLAAKELFPANGDGVGTIPVTVYPLEDDGSGVAADGDISMSGSQSGAGEYVVRVNNIDSDQFVIPDGTAASAVAALMVTAIDAILDMPVTVTDNAGVLEFTAKWAGQSSNDLYVEVIGPDNGITFTVTQASGGLVNPDVDIALNQVGDVWETVIINCMNLSDTATLDKFSTWGEGRWNPLVTKPVLGAFTGNNIATATSAISVPDARKSDRTNATINSPNCRNLPL